jgi:hypothetical protein
MFPTIEEATQGIKVSGVSEFLKHSPTKLLIGGKWMPAKSGKTFETINRANEEVPALVAQEDKADVDEAVKAARMGETISSDPSNVLTIPILRAPRIAGVQHSLPVLDTIVSSIIVITAICLCVYGYVQQFSG